MNSYYTAPASEMELDAASAIHELIFIPGPGMGHVVAAVEFANLIINRYASFSITFFLITDPQAHNYTQSLHTKANPRLQFINLPEAQPIPDPNAEPQSKPPPLVSLEHIERHKPQVREAALAIVGSTPDHVAGIIVDMFCLSMIDVANELKIHTYLFFTSGAAFLSLMLYVQEIHDERNVDITEYKGTDEEFLVPGFLNRVPAKVLPSIMLDNNGGFLSVITTARRIRETKGIFINTFEEVESRAIESLMNSSSHGQYIPPIYPIGPILNFNHESEFREQEIIGWLDNQPASSVVFLCFGSLGSFTKKQIKEIAIALERSGQRFLWSLRQRSSVDHDEDLPVGFVERTLVFGKVIGWAPQLAVLSHSAVGGFVSHCGWNSILESLWFGVPVATWPMYAEQQVNAFEMVVELGMAVEIKMDYREEMGDEIVLSSEEIERGIKQLLMMGKGGDGIRDKVKDMKAKSEKAIHEGGSSYKNLGRLIHDILMHKSPNLKC